MALEAQPQPEPLLAGRRGGRGPVLVYSKAGREISLVDRQSACIANYLTVEWARADLIDEHRRDTDLEADTA